MISTTPARISRASLTRCVSRSAIDAAEVLAHSRQVYLTGEQGVVGAQPGGAGRTRPRSNTGAVEPIGDTGPQGRTGSVGPRGDTGEGGVVGPQGPTGLIGDTLAHHIQLVTGGWLQAGDSTAGVFFGHTGSTFALIGRGGGRTHFWHWRRMGRRRSGTIGSSGRLSRRRSVTVMPMSSRSASWTPRGEVESAGGILTSASWNGARLQAHERAGLHSALDLLAESPVGFGSDRQREASNSDRSGRPGCAGWGDGRVD